MSPFVQAARLGDIPDNQGYFVELGGVRLALFKSDGKVYALANECPHQGGPLSEGGLQGHLAMCPWHGWEFDVRSGICEFNPDIASRTFETKVEKDTVWVKL